MPRVAMVQRTAGLLLSVLMFLTAAAMTTNAAAQPTSPPDPIAVPNPATDLWRKVRDRQNADVDAVDPGIRSVSPANLARDLWLEVQSGRRDIAGVTQVQGPDAGVLINTRGEQWRHFRMTQLVPLAGYVLGGVLIAIALFRVVRGKIRIRDGRSHLRVPRFTLNQRTAHWSVAITFVILGLTGAILMFGRSVLIPVIGNEAFGSIAIAAKRIHDFVGPVFGVALVAQFILFVRGNGPRLKEDIMWILKGGGLFGAHASSRCYNAGEKSWFWLAMLGGLIVVVSGLVLDFPIFGQDREMMSLAHVVHATGAVLILAASFGHIYMGTIAMEGAFETMATGYCDANWAKEHHDLWYENVKSKVEPYPDTERRKRAADMAEAGSEA